MKKLIFIAMISLVAVNLSAAKRADKEVNTEVVTTANEIQGVVFDKSSQESLAGAVILVNGQKVYSDLEGNFTIRNVCNGICELKISMISYEDQIIKFDASKTKNLKVLLVQ
jgi:hypothetical protein